MLYMIIVASNFQLFNDRTHEAKSNAKNVDSNEKKLYLTEWCMCLSVMHESIVYMNAEH